MSSLGGAISVNVMSSSKGASSIRFFHSSRFIILQKNNPYGILYNILAHLYNLVIKFLQNHRINYLIIFLLGPIWHKKGKSDLAVYTITLGYLHLQVT